MRPLARWLLTLCFAVSLLLCVVVCVLWVRSYSGIVGVRLFERQTSQFQRSTYGMRFDRGRIKVRRSDVSEFPWLPGPTYMLQDIQDVPCWAPVGILLILPAVAGGRQVVRRHQRVPGMCLTCGYDVRASPGRCPECGTFATTKGSA